MWHILFILLSLHGPDGREVDVSVDEITSLQCKMPGVENKLFANNVNTVINLTDGRFVSVKETCSEIRDKIREKTNERRSDLDYVNPQWMRELP